jgi:DNA polymerase III gamma/tau subunit
MNTYIISSKNFELAITEIDKLNKENKVDKFDIEILEFEKALGIEDVRNIQKKIFLKPLKGDRKSTILMLKASATVDAQNSMLKLLEEPPPSSLIAIITDNYNSFLPTILSRAKIIELNEKLGELNNEPIKQILEIDGEGDALFLAQAVSKDKNEAIKWLKDAILGARELMLENLEDKPKALRLRKLIHKLELAHYDLKNTNVNTRLALENLFLNI